MSSFVSSLAIILSPIHSSFFTTMATSASFHGVVGLQNGSRYQIDKKNYWRCDGFIATPEIGDIRVNVFTFGANAASVEDYWMRGQLLIDGLRKCCFS
ncbi:hypothetical protein BDR04DRAFT_769006 [Suillus decipiens]|nr:hypothetical protein BDR04DRAFT_769006 [Suillus decipiens]